MDMCQFDVVVNKQLWDIADISTVEHYWVVNFGK